MTFTTQTHAGITFAYRWANVRANVADAYVKRKMYRTTLRELSGLTNRELADIGINRSMIQRLAIEAAVITKSSDPSSRGPASKRSAHILPGNSFWVRR